MALNESFTGHGTREQWTKWRKLHPIFPLHRNVATSHKLRFAISGRIHWRNIKGKTERQQTKNPVMEWKDFVRSRNRKGREFRMVWCAKNKIWETHTHQNISQTHTNNRSWLKPIFLKIFLSIRNCWQSLRFDVMAPNRKTCRKVIRNYSSRSEIEVPTRNSELHRTKADSMKFTTNSRNSCESAESFFVWGLAQSVPLSSFVNRTMGARRIALENTIRRFIGNRTHQSNTREIKIPASN